MDQYVVGHDVNIISRKYSWQMAHKSFLYLGAFYLVWLPTTVSHLLEVFDQSAKFDFKVIIATFYCSQGFLNFFVYMQPKFKSYRQKNPTLSIFRAAKRFSSDLFFSW